MVGPEASKWKEAMDSEFMSMYRNQVLNLVDQELGRNIVGCKWIFKKCAHIQDMTGCEGLYSNPKG